MFAGREKGTAVVVAGFLVGLVASIPALEAPGAQVDDRDAARLRLLDSAAIRLAEIAESVSDLTRTRIIDTIGAEYAHGHGDPGRQRIVEAMLDEIWEKSKRRSRRLRSAREALDDAYIQWLNEDPGSRDGPAGEGFGVWSRTEAGQRAMRTLVADYAASIRELVTAHADSHSKWLRQLDRDVSSGWPSENAALLAQIDDLMAELERAWEFLSAGGEEAPPSVSEPLHLSTSKREYEGDTRSTVWIDYQTHGGTYPYELRVSTLDRSFENTVHPAPPGGSSPTQQVGVRFERPGRQTVHLELRDSSFPTRVVLLTVEVVVHGEARLPGLQPVPSGPPPPRNVGQPVPPPAAPRSLLLDHHEDDIGLTGRIVDDGPREVPPPQPDRKQVFLFGIWPRPEATIAVGETLEFKAFSAIVDPSRPESERMTVADESGRVVWEKGPIFRGEEPGTWTVSAEWEFQGQRFVDETRVRVVENR